MSPVLHGVTTWRDDTDISSQGRIEKPSQFDAPVFNLFLVSVQCSISIIEIERYTYFLLPSYTYSHSYDSRLWIEKG